MSSHRPVWCPTYPPHSGSPWCGRGFGPWSRLPVDTTQRDTLLTAAVTSSPQTPHNNVSAGNGWLVTIRIQCDAVPAWLCGAFLQSRPECSWCISLGKRRRCKQMSLKWNWNPRHVLHFVFTKGTIYNSCCKEVHDNTRIVKSWWLDVDNVRYWRCPFKLSAVIMTTPEKEGCVYVVTSAKRFCSQPYFSFVHELFSWQHYCKQLYFLQNSFVPLQLHFLI